MKIRIQLIVCALALLTAASSQAATISVPAGGDLQAAINAAQPGDTILLKVGASYLGNFTLPAKAGATFITIRSAALDTALPPAGTRITPAYASQLPRIVAAGTGAAFKTAVGAHHWKLQFLEIVGNSGGYGDIIQLGRSSEVSAANQARDLVIDRVYLHGNATTGSKRGIALNSGATTIRDSWISEIKSVGMDTQAICGWNGPGPFLIENNHLEAAAENVMFGGADPAIGALVPSDIRILRNTFTKPVQWRSNILNAPAPRATTTVGGGSLAAGTYAYQVVAYGGCGNGKTCRSAASSLVPASIGSGATGAIAISWAAVPGATSYRVYGRLPTGGNQYWTVTGTTFTDTGAVGTSGTAAGTASRWTVKNLLELKNARRVLVQGNRFEYSWQQDQKGYAVVFAPVNGGLAPWTTIEDVTVQHNIFDHVAGGFVLSGVDRTNGSLTLSRVIIRNNLLTDVSVARWGGSGGFVVVGNGAVDVTVDHNTVVHDGFVVNGHGAPMSGFTYTNNLSRHNTWGIYGDRYGAGLSSISVYFPDGFIRRNVLAGGTASKYPGDNFFPALAAFLPGFADAAAGNYRLASSSPYRLAGTDGKDVGANIDAIVAAQR